MFAGQAQSQRVNRERYVTTLEAKIDKLQSLLIKQLYANNPQTTPSSGSSPAPSPMPSLPSPEQAIAAPWVPQTADLLRGRPRLSTIPSLGPWEGSPREGLPAAALSEGTLAPPEASLSPVPSNSYDPSHLQVCSELPFLAAVWLGGPTAVLLRTQRTLSSKSQVSPILLLCDDAIEWSGSLYLPATSFDLSSTHAFCAQHVCQQLSTQGTMLLANMASCTDKIVPEFRSG